MSRPRRKHSVFLIILEVLIVLLLIIAGYLFMQYSKMKKTNTADFDPSQVIVDIPDEEEKVMEKGYINIALFGVVSRMAQLKNKTRSDSIIIASINKKTKEVQLISVYRDTLLYLNEERGYNKATHAYAYGGPELAVQTLNQNLDLNISDFVTVNFNSLAFIVDALGGVEIEITEDELPYVNKFAKETAEIIEKEYHEITKAGKQTLDGVQAVGYCRVRSTAGGDYKRANRQRNVLSQIFTKLKKADPIKLAKVAEEIFPNVYTSMNLADILALIPGLPSYSIASSEGFPFESHPGRYGKMSVVYGEPNLYENVILLHEKLFGTKDYKPSSRVEEYSKEIKAAH